MNEYEIMHCAAILAAGMLARDTESIIPAEDAVNLMEELASIIQERQQAPQQDREEEWL